MADYAVVKFHGDLSKLANPQEYDAWSKRFSDTFQYNENLYLQRVAKHVELLKLAKEVYGGETTEVRYIRSRMPSKSSFNAKREWEKLIRKFEDWKVAEQKRVAGREAYQRKKTRLMEWTRILEENGFIQPQDFRWSYADKAAANLLIEIEPGIYRRKEPVNTPIIEEGR